KSFREFAMRYCDPKWVLEQRGRVKVKKFSTAGASNVEELAARLAPLMLRRLKSDVLTELPEKIRQTILIPIGSRDVREAIQMEREEQHRHDPHGVVKGELAKARKILGLAKVAPALEHITTLLQSEAKVVVFAHHHDVIDKLADSLGAWLQIRVVTGNTSLAQRHEAVTAFQNDPGVRVFIGNIQAAGVGLTLTAAAVTVFVEQDWGPKIMEQAEDRINRLGQTRGTLIQYICFEGSLDAIMARTCARKEEVIQSIIKPTEGVIEMSIESILERIATALEKQTEQYDALLRKDYIAKPASTAGAAPAAPAPAAPASTAPATGWDPRAEKPLARYGADKRAILESVATEMGLTFDEKTPGTQLHGMILGAGTAAPAPAAGSNEPDLPVDEGFGDFNLDTPPAVEEARKYTAEETRAALIGYCKAQGAKDAAPAGALIKQVLGKDKFTDVDPADYYKLVDAANAASM
ncbi:MAG: DEAD/DEAH box helicase, partial [Armatimonadia bacterium]